VIGLASRQAADRQMRAGPLAVPHRARSFACLLASLIFASGLSCGRAGGQLSTEGEAQVYSLRLVFTEGFSHDSVIAIVDGKEIKPSGPITTRTDVEPPLAWSIDVPVRSEVVSVRVTIQTKNVSESITQNVRQLPQLDVALVGNRLRLHGSQLVPSIG
jgi:hypothetical protein